MAKPTTRLTVYFDNSCPICREEINALKSVDIDNALDLVDCSVDDFSDPMATDAGLDQHTLKNAMHVRDASGRWYKKADAFIAMYETVGIESAARLLRKRSVRSVFERAYPLFVKYRHVLKYTGAHKLMPWFIRRAAAKQARDAQTCAVNNSTDRDT